MFAPAIPVLLVYHGKWPKTATTFSSTTSLLFFLDDVDSTGAGGVGNVCTDPCLVVDDLLDDFKVSDLTEAAFFGVSGPCGVEVAEETVEPVEAA